SDSYGNYNISFSSSYQGSLSGIYATVADYNGYNNGYNNGYGNYKNLYLVATKSGYTSDKYYLSGVNNNTSYETAKEAKVTNANPNTSFINGYNVNAGASVSVKDSSGTTLGTATADANGYFVIYTNRALKSEETLTFTTHVSNSSKDAISTYKVGSDTTKTTTTSTKFKSEFTIGSSKIEKTVDGVSTLKYMDVVPYIKDGRTMMPVRYVAEALGYTVTYNKTTRMASFTNGSNVVLINIDSDEFYVNGEKHTFTVKPEIKDGRTMLPISEVGKALGLTHGNKGEGKNIEWDAENKTVTIQKDK
uniref:stalk domain-containing protein n=1 Tax=Peptoniphilus mikwangii TaxID=1354300 RepID=UPI00055ACDC4